ncbi:MAG TPA: EpsG family protein [Allosphingosinicella sp.]
MFPYWLIFTLCAAGAVQYRTDPRRATQGGPILVIIALMILLMIGLRFEVGGDWFTYVFLLDDYRFADLGEALAKGDPGYSFLNWIAVRLGAGIWFVNLICAAFFTWGLARFVRQQPNPWLAICVAIPYLVIVVAMGYTRQGVAIGLMMAGMSEFRRGHSMLRFGIYIAAAALFHKTAIVILPIVAFAATQNRWATLGIGGALAAILYYLLLQADLDTLMTNYVEADYDAQGAAIRVAMNVLPAILFLLFQRRFAAGEFDRLLWRNVSLAALGSLFFLLVLEASVVVDRLALYLIPLQLVVFSRLPYAFQRHGKPNGLLTLAVIAYSAAVQFVWLTAATHASFWVPYKIYFL